MQKTLTKGKTSTSRWQITLPKNTDLDGLIIDLLARYKGMNLPEITKLALIELDHQQNHPLDRVLDKYYAGKTKSKIVKTTLELDELLDKVNRESML
jgi:hypothetical protein